MTSTSSQEPAPAPPHRADPPWQRTVNLVAVLFFGIGAIALGADFWVVSAIAGMAYAALEWRGRPGR